MNPRTIKTLRRQEASRDPFITFHIFSEGKNTEPDYFKALRKSIGRNGNRIECYGPNGVPKSVANAAIKFAKANGFGTSTRKGRKNSFEENDEVWAVFDRDEHPCYYEAKKICKDNGIPFAYSDPCFELWLHLHLIDYDAPCDRHLAQTNCKKLIKGYDPNAGKTADFITLLSDIEIAENRAESQRSRRNEEANEDGNPSSNMYELTRKIRDYKAP